MIVCPFRTEQGSCTHVDAGVGTGELIVLHPSVCLHCVKNFKQVETRATAATVTHSIYAERTKRGLPATIPPPFVPKPKTSTAAREHPKRENIADEMLKIARSVPRPVEAPVVADPKARLAICEDCPKWIGERCKAACGSCSNRPRPLAETGRDCPLHLWKRQGK
jgi:hypothetical protein